LAAISPSFVLFCHHFNTSYVVFFGVVEEELQWTGQSKEKQPQLCPFVCYRTTFTVFVGCFFHFISFDACIKAVDVIYDRRMSF